MTRLTKRTFKKIYLLKQNSYSVSILRLGDVQILQIPPHVILDVFDKISTFIEITSICLQDNHYFLALFISYLRSFKKIYSEICRLENTKHVSSFDYRF